MQKIELFDIILSVLTSRIFQGRGTSLPQPEAVVKLVKSAKIIFREEPSLLRLTGEYAVVGDLHGNIDDLLRIFEANLYPPESKYVFTGDFVDRGQNSVEVLLLLFALKCLYPSHIYLLRGNHECQDICSVYGFQSECETKLGADVFSAFIRSFSFMPFAAVINSANLCVHGGISPDVTDLAQIEDLQRPMLGSDSLVSNGILWSDPRSDSKGFEPSDRGTGFLFNAEKLDDFLLNNKLLMLIRSHESCQEGFDKPFGDDGKCITVFSNSDYCGMDNNAAIVRVTEDNTISFKIFEPLPGKDSAFRHVIIPEWIFTNNEPKDAMQCPSFQLRDDDIFNSLLEDPLDLFYTDM